MTMKKNDRKENYYAIITLMLNGRNKEAFNKLASMYADDCECFVLDDYEDRMAKLGWNDPNAIPEVPKGESVSFWISVERTNRQGGKLTNVYCAQYTNMPVVFDEDGEPDTDFHLVSEDGETISAVGWHDVKNHYDFDDYYEPIVFNEDCKLLGWKEYVKPEFKK